MKRAILIGIILIIYAGPVLAWGECPFGEVNDPAPGLCGRYLDTDGDNICDYSQPAPEDRTEAPVVSQPGPVQDIPRISGKALKTKTVAEVADFFSIDREAYREELAEYTGASVSDNDSLQNLHDKHRLPASQARIIANNLFLENNTIQAGVIDNSGAAQENIVNKYNFFPVIIILIVLYLLTYSLSAYKVIGIVAHRKIWNSLLLISFLLSAASGLLLVIRINYGWELKSPFNMLYFHVETGIIMAVIAFFHIFWHWQYFKSIIKRKK